METIYSFTRMVCIITFTSTALAISAQTEMPLVNPSFEGVPHQGGSGSISVPLEGWFDVGIARFHRQSPFDVHGAESRFWGVDVIPHDGETYVGLVVRPDESFERIGQKLEKPLQRGHRYELSLFACRSRHYTSGLWAKHDSLVSFTDPVVVAIWGADEPTDEGVFLGRSPAIRNYNWQQYHFTLDPQITCRYLIIEAYYLPTTKVAYAGHV